MKLRVIFGKLRGAILYSVNHGVFKDTSFFVLGIPRKRNKSIKMSMKQGYVRWLGN